jgi:hypothetical protein
MPSSSNVGLSMRHPSCDVRATGSSVLARGNYGEEMGYSGAKKKEMQFIGATRGARDAQKCLGVCYRVHVGRSAERSRLLSALHKALCPIPLPLAR